MLREEEEVWCPVVYPLMSLPGSDVNTQGALVRHKTRPKLIHREGIYREEGDLGKSGRK